MDEDRVFERPHLVFIEPRTSHESAIRVHAERIAAHHRQHGGPVHLVVHVGPATPVPSEEARAAIQAMLLEIRAYATVYIVIDQEGFRGAVFRSVAAALVLLAPAGYSLGVRSVLQEVMEEVAVCLALPAAVLWSDYQFWQGGGVVTALPR